MNDFNWVNFYKELALKLLNYKDNRGKLINKLKNAFDSNSLTLPTLEDGELIDIDPFTIFGLFNKGIKNDTRIKITEALKKEFDIDSIAPNSFEGVPVLNNQNATFYFFKKYRGDHDIDYLWGLFENAVKYSIDNNEKLEDLKKYFDLSIGLKGNGCSKITMGLFWINPNRFLNLDDRNKWYIYDSGKVDKNIVENLPKINRKIKGETYFEILSKIETAIKEENINVDSFLKLSYEAWSYSEEVNKQKRLEKIKQKENKKDEKEKYWVCSAGEDASKWDQFYNKNIIAIGSSFLGNLKSYDSKELIQSKMNEHYNDTASHKNDATAAWEFANVMKPSDVVFVKDGYHRVLAAGEVVSDYLFDDTMTDDYKHIRKIKWLKIKNYELNNYSFAQKTLTDISDSQYIEDLISKYLNTETENNNLLKYTKESFLQEVFMSETEYDRLSNLLLQEKNLILQGAPGVGKTFIAKRLAYSIIGGKDSGKVSMVQFHQSYSYEDFIMGYRPSESNSFKLEKGKFYEFCNLAKNNPENKYFFIIDEINRGNLSKIFGELLMLIESDKRGQEISLLYNKELFSVPENVYIIGMMNTADRSLAMIDYALRRRFSFYTISPAFDNPKFIEYQNTIVNPHFNNLINIVKQLNETIKNDSTLGKGFMIGHSYLSELLSDVSDEQLFNIIEYKLIPLIEEYWFDEESKVNQWSELLRGSLR